MDSKVWNIFIPSNSTLRQYLPLLDPYEGLTDDKCMAIVELFKPGNGPMHGGILFDEIDIPYGLIWLQSSARIVGSTLGTIRENEIEKLYSIENLPSLLGRKILQLVFMATNGSVCIPLAYFISTGATGMWTHEIISKCIQKLHNFGISATWGCSDMFRGCTDYIRLMSSSFQNYNHTFDCTHLVKLGRNFLLDRNLMNDDCSSGFSVRDLFTL